jgi:biopolymer transport protein ExbD
MAGSSYKDDDDAITDINVTPLVDVMLVLLVIFMVTARLIVSRGVEVARPRAAAGGPVASPILVSVDKDGILYVEGEPQPDPAVAAAKLRGLVRKQARPEDAKVIIDGDQAAAYGGVMRAIDVVTAAGIHKIALANAPLAEGAIPGSQ